MHRIRNTEILANEQTDIITIKFTTINEQNEETSLDVFLKLINFEKGRKYEYGTEIEDNGLIYSLDKDLTISVSEKYSEPGISDVLELPSILTTKNLISDAQMDLFFRTIRENAVIKTRLETDANNSRELFLSSSLNSSLGKKD